MKNFILAFVFLSTSALNAAWIQDNKITNVAQYAEEKLKSAANEGLNSDKYAHGVQAFAEFRSGQLPASVADSRFNSAFSQYIDDVRNGRFDPKRATTRIGLRPDSVNPAAIIKEGLNSGGTQWIDQLPPQYPQYKLLRNALISDYTTNDNARKQIESTMESWRWMPRNPGNRYILVNIAGFDLRAYENGQEALWSSIIVGNKYNQTPVFAAEISDLIFNPEWRVPAGIVKEELLPLGMEYLSANGFRKNGDGLIQASGKGNSLGRVRFSIVQKGTNSNPYAVYLHDTSNPELFGEVDRSLGHGCVRVQESAALAEFIFNDCDEWHIAEIVDMMDRSHTNQKVVPNNRVQVLITYLTAWADEDGRVNFYDDVYGHEEMVRAQIGK